jgi:membrane-associated phospholipid phosphatase
MTEPLEPTAPANPEPPSDRLADRLEARPIAPAPALLRVLRELGAVDRAVYQAVAATPTPTIDAPLRRFTAAADDSKLWVGTAAVLFVVGGRKGRRAALTGLASIAATSALVNLPLKLVGARRRPDADAAGVPVSRRVTLPTSASFPSGHSASAAAFTAGVSSVVPALGAPLGCAAAAVGYSRVHSGVHYPGDVVAGVVVGASIGEVIAWAGEHLAQRRRRPRGGGR